jgi:hypothetical protein
VQLHSFSASAPDGIEWSTSHLDHFTPKQSVQLTEKWVGPRAFLDNLEKSKTYPSLELNHDSSVTQAITYSLHKPCYPSSPKIQGKTLIWSSSFFAAQGVTKNVEIWGSKIR